MSKSDKAGPILLWVRRDLRFTDNPVLAAAAGSGREVIPVFICDPVVERLGAAPKWRLGLGVGAFADALGSLGSRLVLRRGAALDVLRALVAQTGASAVWWGRQYDPDQVARDTEVKTGLSADGIEARSFAGHLLFEPWSVETRTGGFYQVYTPFWRAVRDRDVAAGQSAPVSLRSPARWPEGDDLAEWALGVGMERGADIVAAHLCVGEVRALAQLETFIDAKLTDYARARDFLAEDAGSGLSENLTYGEIAPATVWRAGRAAFEAGNPGAETFLKELVWREFSYHLIYHTPHITTRNWREGWDGFAWREHGEALTNWQQGRTGVTLVDAAMRELYVTGRMHNRARMIAGSYLTKNLLTHWRAGLDWFAECLIDWDPAANAMGWQWVAGTGPDAAPYFRIFNPDTQAERFDKSGDYRRRWLAEISKSPPQSALDFFAACPKRWNLSPDATYPSPEPDLKTGRERALDTYKASRGA